MDNLHPPVAPESDAPAPLEPPPIASSSPVLPPTALSPVASPPVASPPVAPPLVEPPPRARLAFTRHPRWRWLMRQLDRLPWLYLPILALLCVIFSWQILGPGDDFWAHAAIGRWIVQHHSVPRHTLFIWSVPPIPWIAHSWLSQLTFYLLMATGGEHYGPYLAMLLTATLSALPFMLIWRLWTQRTPASVLMPGFFTLAIWCAAPRFRPRPELFTAQFLTLLLLFLIQWSDAPMSDASGDDSGAAKKNLPVRRVACLPAWLVLAMFVVWANYHGAVAVGLMILASTVVADLVQDRCNLRSLRLALLGALCVCAIFLNPWGAAYWSALKPVHSAMFAHIDEWKPFWKPPLLNVDYAWGEGFLVVVALLAWGLNPRRRWAHLLWLVLMSVSFIMARRHLWLLALVSLAVMAANGQSLETERLWRGWRRLMQMRQPPAERAGVPPKPPGLQRIARLGVVICLVAWLLKLTPQDFLPLKAETRFIPKRLVAFVQRNHIPGRPFNDYEISSYLQWRFAGHPPLYIDLLNAYPEHLLVPDYFDMLNANQHGRKLLARCGFVILRRHNLNENVATLAKFLDDASKGKQPHWARIYKQPDGTVWVRRTPTYARLWQHPLPSR